MTRTFRINLVGPGLEPAKILASVGGIPSAAPEEDYAEGLYANFRLSAQVVREQGFINTYVAIDASSLPAVLAEAFAEFIGALDSVATAARAIGGLGAIGLDFTAVSPAQLEATFARSTNSPIAMYPLLMAAKVGRSRDEMQRLAGGEYALHELNGYWMLLEKAFCRIYAKGTGASPVAK